jgi:hypothetical protein
MGRDKREELCLLQQATEMKKKEYISRLSNTELFYFVDLWSKEKILYAIQLIEQLTIKGMPQF